MLNKKGKKGLLYSLAVGLGLAVAVGIGAPAMAGTGAGESTGPGGGSTGVSSDFRATWGTYSGSGYSTAWLELAERTNNYRSGGGYGRPEDVILSVNGVGLTTPGMSKEEFLGLCQQSTVIWWLADAAAGGDWDGVSNATNRALGDILVDKDALVARGYEREFNDAWAGMNKLYTSDASRKDIVIVCSAVFTKPETYYKRTVTATKNDSETVKGITSHEYSESPEYNFEGKLSNQSRKSVTKFGELYNSFKNPSNKSEYDSLISSLKSASNNEDKKPTNNFLPSGDPNIDGLKNGGVLNLTTKSNEASVTLSYGSTVTQTQYAVCDANGNSCNWPSTNPPSGYKASAPSSPTKVSSKGSTTSWSSPSDSGFKAVKSGATQFDNGFSQIVANKCNISWYNAMDENLSTAHSRGSGFSTLPSLANATMLNTQKAGLKSKPNTNGKNNTVLLGHKGDSTNANNANAIERTAYSAFYTRPCPEDRWANEQVIVKGSASWDAPYSYNTDIARQITIDGKDPIGKDNLRDQAGVPGNGFVKTPYGTLRDQVNSGSKKASELYDEIEEAIKEGKSIDRADITLNESNQEGMAEGGVLNVFERTRFASLNSAQTDTYYRAAEQKRIYVWNGSSWVAGTWTNTMKDGNNGALTSNLPKDILTELGLTTGNFEGFAEAGPDASYPCGTSVSKAPGSCAPSNVTHPDVTVTIPDNSKADDIKKAYADAAPEGKGWYKKSSAYKNSEALNTPQNTGFWQMVSVHCNPTELNAALAAYGKDYTIVSQNVTDTSVTTVLHTKSRTEMPTANGSKLFGFKKNPVTDPALQRTGELGFYDKECSVICTTSPNGSGASSSNHANNNVPGTTSDVKGQDVLGGAKSGNTNSNKFEMFRDNTDRQISVNVAYPNPGSSSALNYDGSAAISTTATLWHDPALNNSPAPSYGSLTKGISIAEGNSGYPSTGGTPDTSAPGGQLRVGAVKNGSTKTDKTFFTGSDAPKTQKNFTNADSAHPVDTFTGPFATQVAGQYNTFNVASTWASLDNRPVVMNVKWEYQPTANTTVGSKVGFKSNGSERVTGTAKFDQKLDVRCYATYGTDPGTASAYDAASQTGTGVVNNADRNSLSLSSFATSADSKAHRVNTNLVIKFLRAVNE